MYLKEKWKIIFDEYWGSSYDIIEKADFDSFEEIQNTYWKDKNNLFSREKIIKGIDKNNFEIVDESLIRDKNNLFLCWKKLDWININSFEIVMDYDAKSFNWYIPKSHFIKDKKIVFYDFFRLKNCDAKNFKALTFEVWTDWKNIFYKNNIIEWADVNSFKIIAENIHYLYVDKNNVYFQWKILDNIDWINEIKIWKDCIVNVNSLEKVILIKNIRWLKYWKAYYNKKNKEIYNNKWIIHNQKIFFVLPFFLQDKFEILKDKIHTIYCVIKAIIITIREIITDK